MFAHLSAELLSNMVATKFFFDQQNKTVYTALK